MDTTYESELASLLNDLLASQDQLLAILARKRQLLASADFDGLTQIGPQEQALADNLQQCLRRREELLARAKSQRLPSTSLKALTQALPKPQRDRLSPQVLQATDRARLLQHQNLVNWVVVQRTLLHLSQMLEIIATGGRLQPTYGKGEPAPASGALVDRAA